MPQFQGSLRALGFQLCRSMTLRPRGGAGDAAVRREGLWGRGCPCSRVAPGTCSDSAVCWRRKALAGSGLGAPAPPVSLHLAQKYSHCRGWGQPAPRGTVPAAQGDTVPSPGVRGVSHGPAEAIPGSLATPAPSGGNLCAQAPPGVNNLHQTGRAGCLNLTLSAAALHFWGWFSGKMDRSITNWSKNPHFGIKHKLLPRDESE